MRRGSPVIHDGVKPRRWTAGHPDGGRVDADGIEWFACDPYPMTWYRWVDGELITPTRELVWKPCDGTFDPVVTTTYVCTECGGRSPHHREIR